MNDPGGWFDPFWRTKELVPLIFAHDITMPLFMAVHGQRGLEVVPTIAVEFCVMVGAGDTYQPPYFVEGLN